MTPWQIINHASDAFDFPASVPEDARDLIRRLLVQVRCEDNELVRRVWLSLIVFDVTGTVGAHRSEPRRSWLRGAEGSWLLVARGNTVGRFAGRSQRDMRAQNHPYFDGVDWETLESQAAPYTPPPLELAEPKLVRCVNRSADLPFVCTDRNGSSSRVLPGRRVGALDCRRVLLRRCVL